MARPLAILTGASSGIGAALAPILAEDGNDLLLVARREGLLRERAQEISAKLPGARADVLALDLLAPGAAEQLFGKAGGAELVVNCAGFGAMGRAFDDVDLDTYRRMLALNMGVLTDVTILFARAMAARGSGLILNIASTAAFQPMPFAAVYAATKSYVLSLSEGLDYELRRRGVRVLAFCPGPTLTEFVEISGADPRQVESGKFFFQTPDVVARAAARAIRRRRESAVPGLLNRIMAFFSRHGPMRLSRLVAARLFGPPPALKAFPPST